MKKLLLVLAVFLLVILVYPQPASGGTSSPFDAEFTGAFRILGDVGNSPIFIVEESGTGEEQTLEDFAFESYVFGNSARVSSDCGTDTPTIVLTSSVLTFGDGQINLKLVSATTCISGSIITVDDEWRISSGTGIYVGASGELSRHVVANLGTGALGGTLIGTIRLP